MIASSKSLVRVMSVEMSIVALNSTGMLHFEQHMVLFQSWHRYHT